MKKEASEIKREDIHIISRNSNWTEKGVHKALKDEVYNDAASWVKFLRLFFISLGVSFTTAGIIFFFAYNWTDLHKFIKVGLVEGLVVVLTLLVLFTKINTTTKNILLTAASVLVGVLFAVFGQIYQTGANAYDLFFGWTTAIMLWVVVANFAPLWVVFITLINATLVLYSQQVAYEWSEVLIATLLFLINTLFLVFSLLGTAFIDGFKPPDWFIKLVAVASVTCATIGIVMGIYDHQKNPFWMLVTISVLLYGAGLVYGFKIKSGLFLSIIPFSIIVIVSALLIKVSDGASMFFIVCFFVIASVTIVIKNLMGLQKKWINE
ncbi:MAG: membrane protein [Saprospiraceae bacterium]|nr:MAG: membrane protein [Saprospiraceae bacterium]